MRPKTILTKWQCDKLKCLPIQIIDGDRSARYPKQGDFQKTGIVFLNTTNISQNRLNFSEVNFINYEKFSQIKKGRLQKYDIVMTTRGTIGKIALFDHEFSTGLINAQMLILRADGQKIDPIYLFYFLCSESFQQTIKNFSSGSAQPQIPIQDLKEIEIKYPHFPTQRKIAAILSVYDDLIENNMRRIAILKEMAQSLYREWFVHFRFPGHEKKGMVESALGMIPEGWDVVKLGNIAQEIRRSVNPESIDPETPYFGLEHLPRKSIALADWGTAREVQSTKLAFKKGEILFGKIRPYFHKVGVAPLDGVCSSDTIVIVPRTEQYFAAVLSCVSSEDFVNYATKTSQGTKMPRANWDVLVQYRVVIPSQPILYRFNELVKDVVLEIQNMVFRNRNLRQMRDLLLPKLISGEVDVEELEIAGVAGG